MYYWVTKRIALRMGIIILCHITLESKRFLAGLVFRVLVQIITITMSIFAFCHRKELSLWANVGLTKSDSH